MKTLGKVLLTIVAIALVAAIVGVTIYFVRGDGKQMVEDFKQSIDTSFKVKVNDLYYAVGSHEIELPDSGSIMFRVYNGEAISVKVLGAADISYSVEGKDESFLNKDITGYFLQNDDVYADYIVLKCDTDMSLNAVMKAIYGEQTVELPPQVTDRYLYKLVFDCNGETVEFKFCQVISDGFLSSTCAHEFVTRKARTGTVTPTLYVDPTWAHHPFAGSLPDGYTEYKQGYKFRFVDGITYDFYLFNNGGGDDWDCYYEGKLVCKMRFNTLADTDVDLQLSDGLTVIQIIYVGQDPDNNFVSQFQIVYDVTECTKCGYRA